MPNRPLWKDYLSAAVKTGGKLMPGISQAIDVVDAVDSRRRTVERHEETLSELSRIEQSVVEVIEREMKAVLAVLHRPQLTPTELEDEIVKLRALRQHGREPFLAQGLLVNSQWYDQLRAKPNLYGRVLNDHDTTSPDCFYMFIDADKSRLLEVSPFALQQLLAGQPTGAPASSIVGGQDLFAQRVATAPDGPAAPLAREDSAAQRVVVPGGIDVWVPPAELAGIHAQAVASDVAAMAELGYALDRLNPNCRHPDEAKAVGWYRKAADAGNARAMSNLGVHYANGTGVGQDQTKAVELYRKAAEAGWALGMNNLGKAYEFGRGVEKDLNLAARWFYTAAKQGNTTAMCFLGDLHAVGKGVRKSAYEAESWYRKAADAGDTNGMCKLGMSAVGSKRDEEGVEWFRRAAEANDLDGMCLLGQMYALGKGIMQNEPEAVRWYRKAADAGSAAGMFHLGESYATGRGVGKADAEAIHWYRKAAELGNANAMYALGVTYEHGQGVDKNGADALRWYRQAVDAGHVRAIAAIGWSFLQGENGSVVDEEEGLKLLRTAAADGDPWAEELLRRRSNRGW